MAKRKRILLIFLVLSLWLCIGIIDFVRVHRFERPLFCIGAQTADDGGSGNYIGLGYSFYIEGNFMPEDEFPGVTYWKYYLFGIEAQTGRRD